MNNLIDMTNEDGTSGQWLQMFNIFTSDKEALRFKYTFVNRSYEFFQIIRRRIMEDE